MPRTHDRNDFYKLATRTVAKIVIEHRTIRWRTPLQFNDPFDTQTRLTARVDPELYADRFIQRLDELAFAQEIPPYYDPESKLHQAAMVMRRTTPADKRSDALAFMRPSALQSAHRITESLASISDELAAQMQHGRTFCLT